MWGTIEQTSYRPLRPLYYAVIALAVTMPQAAYAEWWCEEPPLLAVVPLVEALQAEYGHIPMMRIASESMAPQYISGDHVIVNASHPYNLLQPGDIIAFWDPRYDIGERILAHRITAVESDRVVTKGDANAESFSFDWADSSTYIGLAHPEPYRTYSILDVDGHTLVRFGDYDMELVGLDGCSYTQTEAANGRIGALLQGDFGWTEPIEGHPLANALVYIRGILFGLGSPISDRTDDTDMLDVEFQMKGLPVYDVESVIIDDEQYIVVATGTNDIYIMDMEDPHNPIVAGSYGMRTYDVEALDGWPYIAALHNDGITLLSIANMDNIRSTDSIEGSEGHAVLVGFDETIMLVTTVGHGIVRQYDVTDPYDIEKAGVHYDDFVVGGVDMQLHEKRGDIYVLLDAGNRGILSYVITDERGPSPIRNSGIDYDHTIHTVVTIGDTKYRITYQDEQIMVYEGVSQYSDPIGSLSGYDVYAIDSIRVDGAVYAVIAAGADGAFGIHIGDEATGKWTFN